MLLSGNSSLLSVYFLQYQLFQKNVSEISSVSNSLDQDLAILFVEPYLGPNCLQRLSADDTSRQRVKKTGILNKTGFS